MAYKNKNGGGAYFALAMASIALAVNFWAWTLLSPLGSRYGSELSLSSTELSFLLAVPIIVGSIGRIILGAITDKYGGRLIFAGACLAMILPVMALAFSQSYNQLVAFAILLGIGGATFAIGIPFVSAWFPPGKRGLVLGIYSMGNAGTAISGLLTPSLDNFAGRKLAFAIVALFLFVIAIVFLSKVKNAPAWKPSKKSPLKNFQTAAKHRLTWDLSLLYMITFGAFVAFGVYLPVLLNAAYDLSVTDAAARAAGFIFLATAARPIGGWLSDKIGGKNIIRAVLVSVVCLASFLALQPSLQVQTSIAYLSLAFALGCGNGAVFALVGKLANQNNIGSVTGIVGAFGGLGGFFPPLVLGVTYQYTNSYSIAFILLALSAFVVFLYINKRFSSPSFAKKGFARA